ncbi:MAG: DUF2924 domain-containing protein [Deltaproteobacteria bacterium]|nr:DUF2924 domain-containing protein [Deltaproteobacteria bacterium]
MSESMLNEIRVLSKMSVADLRLRHVELFGEESRSRNRDYLWKRIAWRIQEVAEGGLDERVKAKARELARDPDLRVTQPRPLRGVTVVDTTKGTNLKDERLPEPGTTLQREFRGRTYSVAVLPDGFEYEGERFKSLSAVARMITGTRWNGLAFFGIAGAKEPA